MLEGIPIVGWWGFDELQRGLEKLDLKDEVVIPLYFEYGDQRGFLKLDHDQGIVTTLMVDYN